MACPVFFASRPFLSSAFRYVEVPVLGRLPMPSALLFDLAVFGLVLGATVLVLIALAHQSIRIARAVGKVARSSERAS